MISPEVFVQMALKSWNGQLNAATQLIDGFSDDTFEKELAPGKNRVGYLVGHLVAANDSMVTLFELGDRQYPQYEVPFLKQADRTTPDFQTPQDLRAAWKHMHDHLASAFAAMTADQWFGKHTAMSDEDLSKDPGRNKLSVLIGRTNHLAYHLGQLRLVK